MKRMLVIGLLVSGCAAMKSPETLAESIRSYNEGVRWGRFEVAAVRIPPADRARFVDDMDQRSNDLRITQYDVIKVDQRGPKEARVQVKVAWYRDPEGILRETQTVQSWERHGKAWWMVDERRLRGAEMPGIVGAVEGPPVSQAPR